MRNVRLHAQNFVIEKEKKEKEANYGAKSTRKAEQDIS